MKVSILLPYKENFSPNYPGAVSLLLKIHQSKANIGMGLKYMVIQIIKKNY